MGADCLRRNSLQQFFACRLRIVEVGAHRHHVGVASDRRVVAPEIHDPAEVVSSQFVEHVDCLAGERKGVAWIVDLGLTELVQGQDWPAFFARHAGVLACEPAHAVDRHPWLRGLQATGAALFVDQIGERQNHTAGRVRFSNDPVAHINLRVPDDDVDRQARPRFEDRLDRLVQEPDVD